MKYPASSVLNKSHSLSSVNTLNRNTLRRKIFVLFVKQTVRRGKSWRSMYRITGVIVAVSTTSPVNAVGGWFSLNTSYRYSNQYIQGVQTKGGLETGLGCIKA